MTIATRGQGVVVDPPDGQTSTQVSLIPYPVYYKRTAGAGWWTLVGNHNYMIQLEQQKIEKWTWIFNVRTRYVTRCSNYIS